MAFAGIFQPFARLRWIRFGLLMRDRQFSRRLSVPQTMAFITSAATAAEGDAIRDSDSRVWPLSSSRSVEKSSASYNRIETRPSASRAEVQPRRHPPLDNAND